MKALAIGVAVLVLGGAAQLPGWPAARCSRRTTRGTLRVDSLPVASNSDAIIATIGAAPASTPTSARASGTAARSGSRTTSSTATKMKKWTKLKFQYADESDPGPYPIPKKVAHRVRQRPPRADRRDEHLQALRAVRRSSGKEGRLRRDLEPELERAAAGRLDVGRRRRPADPPRPRPLRRGRRGLDRPRAPVHRPAHAQAHTSSRPATTRAR